MTTDFDLVVIPSQELRRTVNTHPCHVPGSVHTTAAEWIPDETLVGERGAAQVTPGNSVTANVDFANRPNRNGLSLFVQHVDGYVSDRPPNHHIITR